MDAAKQVELEAILESAFNHADNIGVSSPIISSRLGDIIKFLHSDFSPHDYGYEKLLPLLEAMPNVIELERDETFAVPRYFVSYKKTSSESIATQKAAIIQSKKNASPLISTSSITAPRKFSESVRAARDKFKELAGLALKENWGDVDELPLLRSYVNHTFTRLVFENKVKFDKSKSIVAFDTGLVDKRYQPIYAFLTRNNRKDDVLPWYLSGFCCAGEDFFGKQLVETFNPLPKAAYYFEKTSDAIYDINAGELHCDWEHIVVENSDRIPFELISRLTRGFDVKSCEGMNKVEREQYKKTFADYLKNEEFSYRTLIDTFKRAVELAIKKVRWNYKTAVPVYYPTENTVNLLLPLCLLSDDHVDLALVVEKTDSGNYQGHTIYPLEWAYSNARLISRPESSWLEDK